MEKRRLELQSIFEGILGTREVYYQPPESIKMKYPAIVYSRNNIRNIHADDRGYLTYPSYQVTLMTKNPDSEFIEKILALPHCRWDREFKINNLNHNVFTIY